MGGYLDHQMLIAMPGMVDQNFAGSVTLLCQHNDSGAIGITINRLSEYTLGEILNQLKIDCADESIKCRPVLEGGPVAPDRGFVLHSPLAGYESSLEVGEDIMVTTSRDVLAEIAVGRGPEKYVVALGYAGWVAANSKVKCWPMPGCPLPPTAISFSTCHYRTASTRR